MDNRTAHMNKLTKGDIMNHIAIAPRRLVSAATYCNYVYPTLHPDRVMIEHDLVYIERGSWTIRRDGIAYALRPGDVILLRAGRHHDSKLPCEAGTRTMYIHFSADAQDDIATGAYHIPTHIRAGMVPSVRDDCLRLIDAWWTAGAHREQRTSALLDTLLCNLAERGANQPARLDWPVDIIHSMAVNEPDQNFTAQRIAERLGISQRSLRYRFEQAAGCPLHQYLMNLKLNMAKHALVTAPESLISDVAQTFGFCDEYHLSRAFKKRFGYPPGQYRHVAEKDLSANVDAE